MVEQVIQKANKIKGSLHYVAGLFTDSVKKTCTKMAAKLGIAHDGLNRFLSLHRYGQNEIEKILLETTREQITEFGTTGWFIIDDTTMK